jgi:hydrogenase expression/formation protein HypE
VKRLQLGKLPIDILERTMLRKTGARSSLVATGPSPGLDFAAIKLGRKYLLVSADPITGASKNIGRYAMNISANDVATSGNRPQFAETVILLPEGASTYDAAEAGKQMHETCESLGIAIVGGHTEVTPGLRKPIIIVTAFAYARDYVSAGGAREGDLILMTKFAGLEGTAEIAAEHGDLLGGVPESTLRRARGFVSQVSIVEEAVAAFGTGAVHAMHDCTEGGVLGGVFEMSLASRLGFLVDEALVPVVPETSAICTRLSIDPMRLIGSGSLLIAVARRAEREVTEALRPVCRVTKIGEFRKGERLTLTKGGRKRLVKEAPEDELWRVEGGLA